MRDFFRGERLRSALPTMMGLPSRGERMSSKLPWPRPFSSPSNCFNLRLFCFIFNASIHERRCLLVLVADAPPSSLLSSLPFGVDMPLLPLPMRRNFMLNGDLSKFPHLEGDNNEGAVDEGEEG